jgi:calcineurin-like phosphoesterase family protein
MNREQRFRQSDDQIVHFSSDFHLNHAPKTWDVPICKKRGYDSVPEMNDAIIESVNLTVRPNDILFYLGDVSLNCNESQLEEFLSRIFCQNIYMLWGNHNSPVWNIYRREIENFFRTMDDDFSATQPKPDVEIYPFKYRNITFIGNYAEVIVDGKYIVVSHYPMQSWNQMKNGSIHLYGHQHCENNPVGGKQMDVGWDRDKRPYTANEIFDKMKNIPVKSDGGHH